VPRDRLEVGGDLAQLLDRPLQVRLPPCRLVGPAGEAMRASLSGPLAHDMPYTSHTDAAFRRLAALKPRTLGVMHGATYRGDGERALIDLAAVARETLGK